MAYYELEPFGVDMFPKYFGTIAATIANTSRTKRSKALQWHDFFPPYEMLHRKQTTTEQIAIVEILNEMFGGRDLRAEKETPTA